MKNALDYGKSYCDEYDKDYYDSHCGAPYDRSIPGWLICFGRIADYIVKRISPRTVLDAGCAKGFLVESLRDRGVEAFGVDISEYAISVVREDIRPYCQVGNLIDSLPLEKYDLITCIEVLEHLSESAARKTIRNLCAHTDDIIFSSTPSDVREDTHFNVRPQEYWIELFAACGFCYDHSFDCSFIAPQAMRFRRRPCQSELRVGLCSIDTLTNSAFGQIRLISPLEAARAQFGLTYANCVDMELGQLKLRRDVLDQSHVLIIQRDVGRRKLSEQILEYASKTGKPVVYELDELLTELPESHPLGSVCETLKRDVVALMQAVDVITVPTSILKRHITNFYPDLANKIVVLPNYIDLKIWPAPPKNRSKGRDEKVSILFSGSPTHAEDLKVIEDALLYVLRRHRGKVSFSLWGSWTKRLERFVIEGSMLDYKQYAKTLSRLQCDLAVVPLKDNPYNRAKSAIKWLEYSVAGIPSICSNFGPYSESIKNGLTGLLVSNEPLAWVEALEFMIVNQQWRNLIAENACRQVRERFNIKRNTYKWYDLYLALVDGHARKGCQNSRERISLKCHRAGSKVFDATVRWPEAVVACVRHADERFACGDLVAAKDALGRALEILPDNPELVVTYGNLLLRDGNVEAARREFVKATVLRPQYAPAHADLAAVLLHLGRAAEAESSARQALALEPTNPNALKVLARLCLDNERYTEAVQAYVTILRDNPNDLETLLVVGNCYAEAGRPEDAKTFYQRVLQLDPGNAVAAENLAIINGSASPIAHEPIASIVIVTYNSASTIRACLESVFQCTRPSTELIVVDNGSTDETRAMLDEYQGRITVRLNTDNRGFSRGCNQGIRASHGDYVVLLNPDTVVTSDWLNRLLAHFGPDVGAVGPVSDYVAGLQKVGLYLPEQMPDGLSLAEAGDLPGRVNACKAVETRLLIGFCMVLPRKVLDEVGLLDEELFLGNDDLDLSWRLRQRGYRLLVATDAFVHHEGQVSFKSEPSATTARLVQDSTDRLYAKLETHYGKGNVPDPMELWGITWFKPTAPHFLSKAPDAEQGLTSIIILTHNGLEHTEKCLTSIVAHTPEPHELIIVDNGSTDGTIKYLRNYMATHDNVRVIANRSNRGFAAGNNQGLALARGESVLLLNNDTIVTEGWLRRMVAVFHRHPEVGVVGPMSNYVSGPQLVKGVSYANPEELARFSTRWTAEHAAQSALITRVVGFCLLARKQVIERIGGLDEQFGSGNFEDDDFCIRAAQVGYAARIAQDVFIHHTGSQTFKAAGINYRKSLLRNWGLFKTKWGIPADAPYEQGYRVPLQPPPGLHLRVPLPDLNADYQAEAEGRWWQEVSKACGEPRRTTGDTAQPANSLAEPLSAVIVGNGHGLAPLWPSLVQHTHHPLTITILPSAGNGHGSDQVDQPTCPEGWQVRTGDLPDVRLLNQLLASAHGDPMIVLSSNLILTPGWLKRLLTALKRDQRLAAVGPTSNQGAAPQRVKAEYKGTGKALRQFALRRAHRYGEELAEVDSLAPFCIVFNPAACRPIGSLREDLDLIESLHDYVARLRQTGCTVGVALDAYVHCESSDPSS